MKKKDILKEFDKKFNLPKKPKFICDDLICGYKARKFLSQAIAKAREEGWQTGYQQCKEDKGGLK